MTPPVIDLHSFKERTMPCIPEQTLVLLAGEQEGASHAEHTQHLSACESCSTKLADWQDLLGGLRDTDPVDVTAFDDAYFQQLATEVEAGIARNPAAGRLLGLQILPSLWNDWRVAMPVALAAALVVGLLWHQQIVEAPGALAPSEVAQTTHEITDLEAEARMLGRRLLQAALADESDDGFHASLQYSDDEDDLIDETAAYVLHSSLRDALDKLDDDELSSLFTRL